MIEHIEDEYDKKIFDEYEDDKRQGKLKIYSHEEVWKELGVWDILLNIQIVM